MNGSDNQQKVFAPLAARLFPDASLTAVQRLTGGVSADVYRLDLSSPDGSGKSVVVRIHGAKSYALDAAREFRLLDALRRAGIPVPEPLSLDDSRSVIEDPCVVMSFVEGTTVIPAEEADGYLLRMAEALRSVHGVRRDQLPELPLRTDPLPEIFDFLPEGEEWSRLHCHLEKLQDTAYAGEPVLLHGDFWPENILWQDGSIAAILDWEDSAVGDPLSDVACCGLELRYLFGSRGTRTFIQAYGGAAGLDPDRLALWQVYVAAAAQRFMGDWGLPSEREAHMRATALTTIREAGARLMGGAG